MGLQLRTRGKGSSGTAAGTLPILRVLHHLPPVHAVHINPCDGFYHFSFHVVSPLFSSWLLYPLPPSLPRSPGAVARRRGAARRGARPHSGIKLIVVVLILLCGFRRHSLGLIATPQAAGHRRAVGAAAVQSASHRHADPAIAIQTAPAAPLQHRPSCFPHFFSLSFSSSFFWLQRTEKGRVWESRSSALEI